MSGLLNSLNCRGKVNGEGGNRTHDTTIFSRVLYQLSYLAREMSASQDAQVGRLAFGGICGCLH